MKRISRDPQGFDLMRIIDNYARAHGHNIHDPKNQDGLLAELKAQIDQNRDNPALIHGMRIENMFAFIAASLGKCRIIKKEDAGDIYAEPDISVPDFRIVTIDSQELLVEVKNNHRIRADREYRLTHRYLNSLKAYASLFKTNLYVAIYWSKLKFWTLLSADDFELRDDNYVCSLANAFKRNKMEMLGDKMIGTIPSLTFKLLSDPSKPRNVDDSGHANFVIGNVELYCGDNLIERDQEKQIAWFLMIYGSWPVHEIPSEVVDGQLIATGFRAEPEERENPDQHFEVIGHLSEMLSRQFNEMTAPDGAVELLSSDHEPDSLQVMIPPEYKGEAMSLWRFNIKPSPQGE